LVLEKVRRPTVPFWTMRLEEDVRKGAESFPEFGETSLSSLSLSLSFSLSFVYLSPVSRIYLNHTFGRSLRCVFPLLNYFDYFQLRVPLSLPLPLSALRPSCEMLQPPCNPLIRPNNPLATLFQGLGPPLATIL
jgi:hypothetical protein